MKTILLIIWLFPLAFSQLNFVEKLLQLKSLVCKPNQPLFIFYESNLNVPLEFNLIQFLMASNDSRTVIMNNNQFLTKIPQEYCSLLFLEYLIDVMDPVYLSQHRKIITTSSASFDQLKSQLIEYKVLNTIYLVLNESQHAIYHFNNFLNKLDHWTELKVNPWIEAARDVAGYDLAATYTEQIELVFTTFVVSRINGTLSRYDGKFSIYYTHLDIMTDGLFFQYFYMHRAARYRFLVPTVNKPKPMLWILVDPFDCETWIAIVAMILMAAFFRTCCSTIYTLRQYLRSLQDVFACVVLGSAVVFHRQLDQVIAGLLTLTNVILVAAYESLVISFLLNPRFHPELDTIEQLNESCCWTWPNYHTNYNFRHSNACRIDMTQSSIVPLENALDKYYCFLVDIKDEYSMAETIFDSPLAVVDHYRWSKMELGQHPVLALVHGNVGIREVFEKYSGTFFAEGALYKFRERPENGTVEVTKPERSIRIGDLSLLWVCYGAGTAMCFVIFLGEFVVTFVRDRMSVM